MKGLKLAAVSMALLFVAATSSPVFANIDEPVKCKKECKKECTKGEKKACCAGEKKECTKSEKKACCAGEKKECTKKVK